MGKCVICGKSTPGTFMFCVPCNKLKDDGKIVKCLKCGKWHYADKPCECESFDKNESVAEKETSSVCIICGGKTNKGQFFCHNCYDKYKNKEVLLKITNCRNIELLDESYEGRITCEDGHIVKSKSEMLIDNYLFNHKIAHAYEKALAIDENAEHDLHPDFYLTSEDIYLEHWGYDASNVKYTEQKEYKLKKYKQLGITLICTDEKKDIQNITAALDRKLKFCKKGEINE